MANLLHTKGSRNQILNSFPSNNIGQDGDIIFSRISGKGIYLCSKVSGTWYIANKLKTLNCFIMFHFGF